VPGLSRWRCIRSAPTVRPIPEERTFIDTLQGLLQIGDQNATRIVEVLLMKNSA
jgi:hypothetical protein